MNLSWENGEVSETKKCWFGIGPHSLSVEEVNGRFVISYYLHRLEVGPQPGDKRITITGIEEGQKDRVKITEKPLDTPMVGVAMPKEPLPIMRYEPLRGVEEIDEEATLQARKNYENERAV